MKLHITAPSVCKVEQRYVFDVVLAEWVGVEYEVEFTNCENCEFHFDSSDRRLSLPITFFLQASREWLSSSSLPKQPLQSASIPHWLTVETRTGNRIPVLYGSPIADHNWCTHDDASVQCGVDIFGSIFFLLSQYEAIVKTDRDEHGRFPSKASLLIQENLHRVPVADRLTDLLCALLKWLDPTFTRRPSQYTPVLSSDIDFPFATYGKNASTLIRNCIGDIVVRKSLIRCWKRIAAIPSVWSGSARNDPFFNYSWLITEARARGIQCETYLIPHITQPEMDGVDHTAQPGFLEMLRAIDQSGGTIGIHPGYATWIHSDVMKHSVDALSSLLQQAGCNTSLERGRQHYLRWENSITWSLYEQHGLNYDATIGFENEFGFKAGTCREFPIYDLLARKPLNLRELPLHVMEDTVPAYHQKSDEEFIAEVSKLADIVRSYQGRFSLLWHNYLIVTHRERSRFTKTLDAIAPQKLY